MRHNFIRFIFWLSIGLCLVMALACSGSGNEDDAENQAGDDESPGPEQDDDNNDNDDNDDNNDNDNDALSADVIVDPDSPGATVPNTFLGISVEWTHIVDYLGENSGEARAATVQLLRNFEAEGHRPVVRIGGNSQDRAWWNPDGLPRPPGVEVDLDPLPVSILAALNEAAGTSLVLGLNLVLGDAANAAAVIAGLDDRISRDAVAAFELGNEPDYYWTEGLRPLFYRYDHYRGELETFHDGLAALVSPVPPFAAPALGSTFWLRRLADFFSAESDWVAMITTHVYPFTVCYDLPPPAPARLLDDFATVDIGVVYEPVATAAHAAGYTYRMDELNSVSCGGADGVSNAYVAALWSADVAFRLAAAGLDGLNFHTPGTYYGVFNYDETGALVVMPLYYGMRLFSLATAANGRLLPAVSSLSKRVRVWATLGDDGAVRVLLLNEELTGDSLVKVRVKGRPAAAKLIRLRAPAIDAQTGLTLGGQTWDGSSDGLPLGDPEYETPPRKGDTYYISLPALQAVVVTVPPVE
ncbi:MAG: hypothetical protein GX444_17240 [Myxococcales bacterium]|nr:hypothetical protein [Myxococcales bacterium]